jgi:hypothetical protein
MSLNATLFEELDINFTPGQTELSPHLVHLSPTKYEGGDPTQLAK